MEKKAGERSACVMHTSVANYKTVLSVRSGQPTSDPWSVRAKSSSWSDVPHMLRTHLVDLLQYVRLSGPANVGATCRHRRRALDDSSDNGWLECRVRQNFYETKLLPKRDVYVYSVHRVRSGLVDIWNDRCKNDVLFSLLVWSPLIIDFSIWALKVASKSIEAPWIYSDLRIFVYISLFNHVSKQHKGEPETDCCYLCENSNSTDNETAAITK